MPENEKINAEEAIRLALRNLQEEDRVREEWNSGGHLEMVRRCEVAWFPDRLTEDEKSHIADCPRCRHSVDRFRTECGEAVTVPRRSVARWSASLPYSLAPVSGVAAHGGPPQPDEVRWQLLPLGNASMEAAAYRASPGKHDVWVRLRRRVTPLSKDTTDTLETAVSHTPAPLSFVITLGGVHRWCLLVQDINNYWTAAQRFEGEFARRVALSGELSIVEFDPASFGQDELPLLVESLQFAARRKRLYKIVRDWTDQHARTTGAGIVREALAAVNV